MLLLLRCKTLPFTLINDQFPNALLKVATFKCNSGQHGAPTLSLFLPPSEFVYYSQFVHIKNHDILSFFMIAQASAIFVKAVTKTVHS